MIAIFKIITHLSIIILYEKEDNNSVYLVLLKTFLYSVVE